MDGEPPARGVVWFAHARDIAWPQPGLDATLARDGDYYRLATASAMEGPTLKSFNRYQNFWASIWRDMFKAVTGFAERYGSASFASREAAEKADDMCLNCPVIGECFVAGSNGNWGQWGGIFWNGSGKPDLKANAHKTEEYLKEVEQLVSITLQ